MIWPVRLTAILLSTVIVPVLFLVLVESGLFLTHRITGKNSFDTLVSTPIERLQYVPYRHQKKCRKVATFGGSNIAGFSVELPVPVIIDYELSKQAGCYFVKNLGAPGAYMTGHGDLLLESLDSFYDHFLVYSGHNEVHSLVDQAGFTKIIYGDVGETGSWKLLRQRKVSEHHDPSTVTLPYDAEVGSALLYYLAMHSRLYALLSRIKRSPEDYRDRFLDIIGRFGSTAEASVESKLTGGTSHQSNSTVPETKSLSLSTLPSRIEDDHIVDGISTLPKRYESSLAKLNKSKTIISTVAGNLFFPPNWSVGSGKNAHYYFDRAIDRFTKYGMIDWHEFEIANSIDGFPVRVLDGVNAVIKSSGLRVIDFDAEIKKRIENGEKYGNYFNDVHHLNNVGHILLSRYFLCEMGYKPYCSMVDYNSLKDLEELYLTNIYDSWKLDSLQTRNLLTSLFWHHRMAEFSSCPLCWIRSSVRSATQILGSEIWRYQAYVDAVHDITKYDHLDQDDVYSFTEYFPAGPIARKATRRFFVNNLRKLAICKTDDGYVSCPDRDTRAYLHWNF